MNLIKIRTSINNKINNKLNIMEVNGAFTITKEECEKLEEEYLINDCIYYLMKSRGFVGGNKTIDEAIEELKTKTRFADEVQKVYEKNLGSVARDFLNFFNV